VQLSVRFIIAVLIAALFPAMTAAQNASNVLLIRNDTSPDSQQIAARYASTRHIPAENILPITVAPGDEIDRAAYEAQIEQPIGRWIQRNVAEDRILYIVLTKGIPLRIRGTTGQNGTVASVDSELTLLYRKLLGLAVPMPGPVANPYFLGDHGTETAKPFSHAEVDIYLVTRLDGFTLADVFHLIDQGAAPAREGDFLLDQRATLLGDRTGDAWLAAAAKELTSRGFTDRVVLDTGTGVLSNHKQVLGYYSWGSNDPAIKQRHFDLEFVPGALAAMFVSTDARTLKEPPSTWTIGEWVDPKTHYAGSPQSLTGDLIREGATGVAGHVAEPFLGATIRPQVLFPAYTSGFNLAESFYLAMPYLSWQTVVIGDPLCAPFPRVPLNSLLASPAIDPNTEAPVFYSLRRVAISAAAGMPQDAATLAVKGDVHLAAGDLAGAAQALEAATKLYPKFVPGQLTLASMYEASAQYDKAIERYRAVLEYAPNEFISLNNLAYALAVHKGAPAEALPLALKAYQIAGGAANVADTLGWIQHLLGDEQAAEKLLAPAAKALPGNGSVHLHLAAVYGATGRRAPAAVELAKALELDPALANDPEAKKLGASPAPAAPSPRP